LTFSGGLFSVAFVVAGLESPNPPTVAVEVPPNLKAGAEPVVAPVKLKPVVAAVVVLPNKLLPKPVEAVVVAAAPPNENPVLAAVVVVAPPNENPVLAAVVLAAPPNEKAVATPVLAGWEAALPKEKPVEAVVVA